MLCKMKQSIFLKVNIFRGLVYAFSLQFNAVTSQVLLFVTFLFDTRLQVVLFLCVVDGSNLIEIENRRL